jgi:hypothetical protein
MKKLLAIADLALAVTTVSPALAERQHIAVGDWLTIRQQNPYNRDAYGCYDLENAIEAESIRNPLLHYSATPAWSIPLDAVESFVRKHDPETVKHKPDFPNYYWSNACIRLFSGTRYDVVDARDYGGVLFVCLKPPIFDVRSPKQKAEDEKHPEPQPDRPYCFWTTFDRSPPMSRD